MSYGMGKTFRRASNARRVREVWRYGAMWGFMVLSVLCVVPGSAALAQVRPSVFDSVVTQITSGNAHNCALTTDGDVQCWGANSDGQLGDGTAALRRTPQRVLNLSNNIAQVSAGGNHTCVLTMAGAVRCWGRGIEGQLGTGNTVNVLSPVDVAGLSGGVVQIAAGGFHTCTLSTAGAVQCWGSNQYGQLGDSTGTTRLTPVTVTGLTSGIVSIAAGDFHTCALNTAGGVKCWGRNNTGQLGDNTSTDRSSPVAVSNLVSGVTQLAVGRQHTCALDSAGNVRCWGWNADGQLGDNSTANRLIPVQVTGLTSGVAQIDAGRYHSCAVTSAGLAKCWGENVSGQLGDGTTTSRLVPADVASPDRKYTQLVTGTSHTCALVDAGRVECWGANSTGQLGDDRSSNRQSPVDVWGLGGRLTQLVAGIRHT